MRVFVSPHKCDIVFKITNISKFNNYHLKFNSNFKSDHIIFMNTSLILTLLVCVWLAMYIKNNKVILHTIVLFFFNSFKVDVAIKINTRSKIKL